MNIRIGDYYYFKGLNQILVVSEITNNFDITDITAEKRVSLNSLAGARETSMLAIFVRFLGKHLGNTSTLSVSQLQQFYPELFI